MTLYSLAYVSRSRLDDLVLDPRIEIEKILQVSRSRNKKIDITGVLMFNEQMFTQVLEGAERDVCTVFGSIERDARHADVSVLATGPVEYRRFASWKMAYAGTSEASRAYYRKYVQSRASWAAMSGEKICELMLAMIAIDEAVSPPGARRSPAS
jgi:hypothetical protein